MGTWNWQIDTLLLTTPWLQVSPQPVGLQLASLSTTSIGESNDQTDSHCSIRRVVPRRTWLSAIKNQEKRVHKTEGYYSFGRIQIIFWHPIVMRLSFSISYSTTQLHWNFRMFILIFAKGFSWQIKNWELSHKIILLNNQVVHSIVFALSFIVVSFLV